MQPEQGQLQEAEGVSQAMSGDLWAFSYFLLLFQYLQTGTSECKNKAILEQLVEEGACDNAQLPSKEEEVSASTQTSLSGMKKPGVRNPWVFSQYLRKNINSGKDSVKNGKIKS